ncbi:MAG: ABC transporter permease [Lachnospiraceae bacterium]|nr:ABC transporter permease [Lachnospiraceae bacterium]
MYLQILKKDLRRKRTMNLILLIFIILASTFIASSANNMVLVFTALDNYFEKAQIPDYCFAVSDEKENQRFLDFAEKNNYEFKEQKLIQTPPEDVKINGKKFKYFNSLFLSQLKDSTKVFDKNDREITQVNEGEMYVTSEVFHSSKNKFQIGESINITVNGKSKSLTLKGYMKDAMYGSPMMGMTRFMLSPSDYDFFYSDSASPFYTIAVYADSGFWDEFNNLKISTAFHADYNGIKNTYMTDIIMSGVMLIVSICLILISIVILRFTIHFTLSEEFREIGVMKAIGIRNQNIRGLYITKYFAIAAVGGIIGLIFSFPFGNMMIGSLSQNIVISGSANYILNILCAAAVVAFIVLFCYFCTRKVKKFSPIDAIRNGESGERYHVKGVLHLSKSRIAPVPFMALNDILSGIRRYITMILIFTLGILLIIIPVNTINTLQSDQLVTWFNMAECDHVASLEQLFNANSNNIDAINAELQKIRAQFRKNKIEADVFQEIMFTMHISSQDKTTSSLAFQGAGDITTDRYQYLSGTAPQNTNEVAITYIIADMIGADIGDTVSIKNGETAKDYIVTAIYQSMNNMGEGIRFHPDEELEYRYASGCFGIQIAYHDNPSAEELDRRKDILKDLLPEAKVHTAGSYVNEMIGDIAGGMLQDIKKLILIVVLSINILVAVLMVRSFITKEKGEIAIMKAIGFKNSSLVNWQTLRIGIVLLLSTFFAVLLSTPLSQLSVGPIFRIMGAQSISFKINALETFVFYPLVVLFVTALASMLAALRLCKISAAETSNIE